MKLTGALLMLAACDGAFDLVHVKDPITRDADLADVVADTGRAGVVAHYTMDDVSSGVVANSSGTHDGHCTQCPVVVPGKIGMALEFDGVEQIVRINSWAALETPLTFTVLAWVRLSDATVHGCGVNKVVGNAQENTWQFCVDDSAVASLYSYDGAFQSQKGPVMQAGTWYHLGALWDGQTLTFVVDGAIRDAAAAKLEFDAGELTFGGDIDDGLPGYFWHGAVDDVWVFDRALDLAELREIAGL